MIATAPLAAGFTDPPSSSQRHFRGLLDAMSRPGRVVRLAGELPAPPGLLHPAAYALLLSLADFETPIWLDRTLRSPDVVASLRFHCGCPLADATASAAFAIAAGCSALPDLAAFAQGSAEYPDRSTTLILQVPGLGRGTHLRLTGPGIDGVQGLAVAGTGPGFWAQVRANRGHFPLGVDLVLVADGHLAALPRSTTVEVR